MKVENMKSPRTGRAIPNQFIIVSGEGVGRVYGRYVEEFQSYYTTIVRITRAEGEMLVELDRDKWDCSRTTSRYRNIFLDEKIADTRAKIKSGEYILTDLN